MLRKREGSVLCPSCGQLVGVNDEACYNCGRRHPGLWGFAPLLGALGRDMGFTTIVLWSCSALYLATLVADVKGITSSGLLSLFSPSLRSLFLFGASGSVPVFRYGRWWTVLSAAWLHGGVLHILFNMMAIRDLGPPVAHLYGAGRTVVIYTIAAITGFTLSACAGQFLPPLPLLHGAALTIGASAPLFGLIGALFYYGRRGGSRIATEHAKAWAVAGLVFGFLIPGIDNWAHLGGLAGGYLASRWLDPLLPERGDHYLAALGCLLLSAASIVASVVYGLPLVR
jgi:membrane associated rhomboid family serine protease